MADLHPRYEDVLTCVPERGVLRLYYEWAVRKTHAPPIFHAVSMLPSLGYELNRQGVTFQGQPWRMLVALVGPSGCAKSTAAKLARKMTRAWQQEAQGRLYVDPYLQASGSLPGILQALTDRFDEERQHTRAILTIDELSQMLTHDDVADTVNRLVDGDDYERHLRYLQKEKIGGTVKTPVLGGLFASTPESLQATVSRMQSEGGLFSRLVWAVDHIRKGEMSAVWSPNAQDERFDTALHWFNQLSKWLMVKTHRGRAALPNGDRISMPAGHSPLDVTVTKPATKLLADTLWAEVERRMVGQEPGASTWLRLYHTTEQIAALYAVSDGRLVGEVEDMVPALALTDRLLRGVLRLHPTIGVSALARKQAQLLEMAIDAGSAGVRFNTLYRRFRAIKSEVEQMVAALVDQGYVTKEPVAHGRGPTTWVVKPTFHALQVDREHLDAATARVAETVPDSPISDETQQ